MYMDFNDDEDVVNNKSYIVDIRTHNEFSTCTFSGCSKTKCKTQLIKALKDTLVEHANIYVAELVCAGHVYDVWDCLIEFFGKYVHPSQSMSIATLLKERMDTFNSIVRKICTFSNMLPLRNNCLVRRMFCELVCVLCFAKQWVPIANSVSGITDEFIMKALERLKAPHQEFAVKSWKEGDPVDLYIGMNELAYSISTASAEAIDAYFWVEWIYRSHKAAIDAAKKNQLISKPKRDECDRRMFSPFVESKHQKQVIWLAWDVILREGNRRGVPQRTPVSVTVSELVHIFSFHFLPSQINKRKHLLYLAIYLLCEPVAWERVLTEKFREYSSVAIDNIDIIYFDRKHQSAVAGNLEHLYIDDKLTDVPNIPIEDDTDTCTNEDINPIAYDTRPLTYDPDVW